MINHLFIFLVKIYEIMKIASNLIILLFLNLFISCSEDNDSINNSEFEGNWSGTFSGNDSGTWNAEIFSNGNINAELFSSIYNNSFSANGVVDNSGNVNLTFGSTSTGAVFTGQFSNSSASGTWTNESLSYYGTWSGGLAE